MGQSLSEIRWAENEVIFRQANKGVLENVAETKAIAEEENQTTAIRNLDDLTLLFYCECADERCRQRILIKPSEYKAIHKNRNCFTIVNGHEIKSVEQVVRQEPEFAVIEKFKNPPESASKLNRIDGNGQLLN